MDTFCGNVPRVWKSIVRELSKIECEDPLHLPSTYNDFLDKISERPTLFGGEVANVCVRHRTELGKVRPRTDVYAQALATWCGPASAIGIDPPPGDGGAVAGELPRPLDHR